MLFAALVLIGGLSYSRLAVDLLPSITHPRLTVLTTYEDIPAEDLERLVSQRLEEVVTSQAGVRDVISRTREGVSVLTVEYEWGTQMDFANLHLREAVDRVVFRDDFPEEADRPVILRWDPASRPISILVLEGEGRLESLTEFGREVIKPILEQVDGISRAEVVGGADREILVEPDAQKMALYGVGMDELRQALVRSNISFPGGKVRRGPLQLSLRIDGELESLDEIAATDILHRGGVPLRIGDVARVLDTVKEPEGATLLGARQVVAMLIYKEPDANTLQASERVDEALAAASADYADFAYTWVYRDAEHVRASFEGLVQSLLVGGALAILVLFFFLGDLRSPIVVGLAIPVSIAITFGLLFFGGVKLNLMSLGGLSLAAGMLVDNSIVVLENINRHLRRRTEEAGWDGDAPELAPPAAGDLGPPAGQRLVAGAVDRATVEVARPVVAATFTTIAVFFPVVYVPGVAGAFFRDQALTVTFSLLVSIGAALLLQPVLAVSLLRAPAARTLRKPGPFARFFGALAGAYHRLLVAALKRPKRVLAIVFVALIGAVFLARGLDRSFLPERSLGDMRVDLEWPAGTPLEETVAEVSRLAHWIEEQPGVAVAFAQVGQTERTLAAVQEATAPHNARLRVILDRIPAAAERGRQLQDSIAARLEEWRGVT
ncbi:MAG: efflux RND transporter permease subunit, partial [Holophagales bacterium]|nr:efflux RND transporter permease subunit [Holophagales bacterium]